MEYGRVTDRELESIRKIMGIPEKEPQWQKVQEAGEEIVGFCIELQGDCNRRAWDRDWEEEVHEKRTRR